jgi:PAS domain S-box-containing protein
MPDASQNLASERHSLEVENQALRAEIAWLQAERVEKAVHKELADAYQYSQRRFRTIFEHSPLGHKIIAPDLTIIEANPAMAALLGLPSPEHLVGRRIVEFAHPDKQADWARLQEALWSHHLPWFALETCLLRPDGSSFWCRVTSVLFPDARVGECGFSTLEDITARKQLEERAQQHTQQLHEATEDLAVINEELRVTNEELIEANDRLGHTNVELDNFVYAASHDLKAPIINLESLMQALHQQLPEAARQAEQVEPILEMMKGAIARFRHTLEGLTDIGSMQVEATKPREIVRLGTVVEDVRLDLLPLLTETGGQLDIDLAGNPTVSFSAKNLRSIIYNLLSNALKYHHPDRPPIVRVRSQREVGGHLILRVEDNGLGLDPHQQTQLFTLFRRLHSHVEGSGVGLYLVKKTLANGGGSIRVESQLGRGSTFIVAFPA